MFEKEIIWKEQLAALCLFQCSVGRNLATNDGHLGLLRVARQSAEIELDEEITFY
jgi:hypothetical protein